MRLAFLAWVDFTPARVSLGALSLRKMGTTRSLPFRGISRAKEITREWHVKGDTSEWWVKEERRALFSSTPHLRVFSLLASVSKRNGELARRL